MDARSDPAVELDPRVEAWLEAATRRLADEARERIRDEIADHVAESAAGRTAAGAAPDEAVAAAVAALGDPERAGRAFRRANLSRREAKIVGSLAEPQPLWMLAFYLLGIPAFVFMALLEVDTSRELVLAAFGLAGVVAGILARFWLARRLARHGRLRSALVADVFGPWLFYASLVVGGNVLSERHDTLSMVIYAAAFVVAAVFVARLWPKVRPRRPRTS